MLRFQRACRRSTVLALAGALAILTVTGLSAAEKGLTVPRFVALRSAEVNLRTGPGERYPIEWVYRRKDLPVEIVAEFDNWRKIRDADGTEGWVHERMVTGRRSVLVRGAVRALREAPRSNAEMVARAEPGVVAKLLECNPGWCRIEANGIAGWLPRDEIWGVYPGETVP